MTDVTWGEWQILRDAFEATYSDWKVIRGRKCVQIVLEVPLELSNAAYTVLGGMPNPAEEIWVGVARLDLKARSNSGKEPKARESQPAPEDHGGAPVSGSHSYSQECGRLCNDIRFQKWMAEHYGIIEGAEATTIKVRQLCDNVASRRFIIAGEPSGLAWELLVSAYLAETRV